MINVYNTIVYNIIEYRYEIVGTIIIYILNDNSYVFFLQFMKDIWINKCILKPIITIIKDMSSINLQNKSRFTYN